MDADLGRGGAGPRRAPILPGSLLIQLHGWQTDPPRNAVFCIFWGFRRLPAPVVPAGSRLPGQRPRQNGPLALGVCHSC